MNELFSKTQMSTSFRKVIGALVLAGALVPVILSAVPSAQAATVCDVANPCLPQNAAFTSTIATGNAVFLCQSPGAVQCLTGAASAGTAIGVVGTSLGSAGVVGITNATNAAGVYGHSANANQSTGAVYGENGSSGPFAVGVKGSVFGAGDGGLFTSGENGWGVEASGGFYGVRAESAATTQPSAAGVYGKINSSADYSGGVRGENFNTACCGFGVVGFHAGQGIGIGGYAPNGFGVFGWSPNNWAAWLDGAVTVTKDLHVNGTLYKGAGAFRIDNPLDPAHSYLQHSFVESPDMKNIYDGNVVTNAKGYATVTLPRWFQALNRDFRYQLTILGHSSWDTQARVWDEMKNNRFTIRTNHPRVKVSWQVTGIRHDPYANSHRIPTVVPKTGAESGKYAHPQLYGEPAGKGVTALPERLKYSKQALTVPKLKRK